MHRCSFGTRLTAVFTALAFSMALLGPAPARAAGKLKIMTATTEDAVPPLGNPHYWLEPENRLRLATDIADKLDAMRPEDAAYLAQRYADFEQRLKQEDERWLAEMKPYAGGKIVTYHPSWPKFAE